MPKADIAESEIENIRSRLSAKTMEVGDCELWTGRTHKGYGEIIINREIWRVHRLTWTIENGPIPEGLGVLHECDNRACRKLSHLFLGDALANNIDRDLKGRGSAGKRERHGHAKLTETAVAEIRASREPARLVAPRFGVTIETIRRVRRGEAWGSGDAVQAQRNRRRRERELTIDNNKRRAAGLPPHERAAYGSQSIQKDHP